MYRVGWLGPEDKDDAYFEPFLGQLRDLGGVEGKTSSWCINSRRTSNFPVEEPMKFDLIINLKTAKAIGLTIPPEVLFQADKVIR